MPDGADTTRDAVAAAFKEVTEREPTPAPEPAAEPAPEPSSAAPAPEAESAEPSKTEPKRDGKGRFIVPPKQKPAASVAPATSAPAGQGGAVSVPAPVQGAAPPAVQKALEALKPPQSLKAMAREKWPTWPRDAQEEYVRLQHEASRTLAESVATRKAWDTHQQAISPYEGMIRAEGMEPAQAVGLLLQREQALRTAPMQTRAKILAHGFIHHLGTGQEAIDAFAREFDAMVHGQAGQQQNGAPQQFDPNQIIAQAEQRLMQRLEQARNQSISNSAETDVQQFAATHQYMDERGPGSIPDLVAYVLQSHVDQNLARKEAGEEELPPMSIEEAYNQAIRMHPKTAPIIAQTEAAKAATAKAATMQAARAASSSLRNEPAGPSNGKAKDVREAVAEAYYAQKNAR